MYHIQKNKEAKINSENMHAGKGIIHRKPIFRDVSKLELIEITPENIRMRKMELDINKRN